MTDWQITFHHQVSSGARERAWTALHHARGVTLMLISQRTASPADERAAGLVLRALVACVSEAPDGHSKEGLRGELTALNRRLLRDPRAGRCEALVVILSSDATSSEGQLTVEGVSAGDHHVAWLAPDEPHRPLSPAASPPLGSGAARPSLFQLDAAPSGTLLVANDALLSRVGLERAALAAREPTLPGVVYRLCEEAAHDDALGEVLIALARPRSVVSSGARPATLSPCPRSSAPRAPSPAAPSSPQPAASSASRLLMIENHGAFISTVRSLFLGDHDVVVAATCAEARALIGGRFDALLIDHDLPDGDGATLVAQARSAGVGTPIIAISALPKNNQRMLDAGADAACSKLEFHLIGALLKRILR